MRAIWGESRKPPSVTMPATPRFHSRVTRIPPAEAADALRRLSITKTWPGGHSSTPLRCGVAAAFEHAQVIEVFPRRDVAQRVGRTDHRRPARIEAMDALDEGVAKAALEQHGGEGGGGDRRQLLPALRAEWHGDPLRPSERCALPAGCQFLSPNVSACIRAPNLRRSRLTEHRHGGD